MTSDLKVALRQLRKTPGFTVTAILTLALGIGANAIVFSVLNAIVLKPVKVPHPENLYMVQRYQYPSQSVPDYEDLRDKNRTFQNMTMYNIIGPVGFDTGNNPITAWPYEASGNYFDALEIHPYVGRFFHKEDEKGVNSAPWVVLSYDFWHTQFHDDRSVVGRVVQVNRHPMTIIGVAPPGFRGTEMFFAPAFWFPLMDANEVEGWDKVHERGSHSGFVVGRLKPGVTPAEATADLASLASWLAKTYPKEDDGVTFSLARPGLVGDMLGKPARAFVAGLMLLAGLILLAACANLGSLFAARAADRAKEVALRVALGSRRGRIVRQLLTEAVAVSLAGGALGLAGGVVILRWLSAWQPVPSVPINVPVNPDLATYGVALGMALVSGLLFGMVPVRQVLRTDPWQVIRTGGASLGGMRRVTLRDLLLVGQIAICAVLVTSSLVAVRGLARSLHSNFGFDPNHVVVVSTDLQMAGYTAAQQAPMQKRMVEAIAALPGITSVGYSDQLPLSLGGSDSDVYKDTTTDFRPTNAVADSMNYTIAPGYLPAAGTTLLAGRNFTMHDDDKTPIVALVNRTFAVKVFGSVGAAIGGHFKYWGGKRAEVVGVVEDGKYRTLTEDQMAAMFFSFLQQPNSSAWLEVRSMQDPAAVSRAVEETLHRLDPGLPLQMSTWNQEMDSALFAARVATVALGVLGLLGAMLAVTGIFGMASYVVTKRMRELGIRVALGAGQKQVLGTALGRAFLLLAGGSVAGIVLGLLATKVLSAIVYQATPKDPVVLAGVVSTMLALGLVAAWIPARKALAVDPMILLRDE
ncbi:MAG TPA: ABC transporter permease [Acidobacteriaceae bacterium]|jgi:predicted permease|nr:ABC transporter permease [Acidobacteriaceae bacterium]